MSGYTRKRRRRTEEEDDPDFVLFDTDDPVEDDQIQFEHVTAQQPYIPPIAEDPDIPHEDDLDTHIAANGAAGIQDTGDPPMKRNAIYNPGSIPYNQAVRTFEFNDADIHREFQVPRIQWVNHQYNSNYDVTHFVQENMPIPHPEILFPSFYGPHDSFNGRTATCEFTIKNSDYKFDALRAIIPDIGYAAGLCGMWMMKRMDKNCHISHSIMPWFKAMVSVHCVFYKPLDHGDVEYRRYIFDNMCEDDNGYYLRSRNPERMFKIIYNTLVKICYDKLDMRNVENVPFLDSRFFFYEIRLVSVSIFQYEPLAIGNYIEPNPEIEKFIINPKVDEFCFNYSVKLGALKQMVPKFVFERMKSLDDARVIDGLMKTYGVKLDFEEFHYPYFIYDEAMLTRFCQRNPAFQLYVWVLSEGDNDRIPIHVIFMSNDVRSGPKKKKIHLLLLTSVMGNIKVNDDNFVDHHFAMINNLDGFLKWKNVKGNNNTEKSSLPPTFKVQPCFKPPQSNVIKIKKIKSKK